ncbi:hypothetical protein [Bradyrhizobium sp.]|uniref:hypothetical protein n=1 Tax=Bradyrhizobium sp. TaxID=376 RepID=UPI00260885B6|nr:hypothetical protein [Bradyrhizobium sp.]
MPSFKSAILASAILLLVVPAVAQTGQRISVEQFNAAPRQENMVRIQNSISFFLAGSTGEGDDAQKLRERAQRAVYEMAAHQCDMLRDVLAKDCRLETVNVNVNANNTRQFNQQQVEGLNVSGSMAFQISLK